MQESNPSRLIFLFIHPSLRRVQQSHIAADEQQRFFNYSSLLTYCSANPIILHVLKLLQLLVGASISAQPRSSQAGGAEDVDWCGKGGDTGDLPVNGTKSFLG